MSINQPYNRYSEQPCRTRCSTFNVSIVKLKIRLRLEPAHVQPEASETFTQHRANPASTSDQKASDLIILTQSDPYHLTPPMTKSQKHNWCSLQHRKETTQGKGMGDGKK